MDGNTVVCKSASLAGSDDMLNLSTFCDKQAPPSGAAAEDEIAATLFPGTPFFSKLALEGTDDLCSPFVCAIDEQIEEALAHCRSGTLDENSFRELTGTLARLRRKFFKEEVALMNRIGEKERAGTAPEILEVEFGFRHRLLLKKYIEAMLTPAENSPETLD